MTRRDLELVSDALGQALAEARRVGGETGPRVDAVVCVVEEFERALSRDNRSFQGAKFREAVRKAAANAAPRNGGTS